jgi:hypothetical protein
MHVRIQLVEHDVARRGGRERGGAFVVFSAGRDGDVDVAGGAREELALGRRRGEIKAELGFVALGLAGRRVMHLKRDLAIRANPLAGAFREKRLLEAGNVAGEEAAEAAAAREDVEECAFEDERVMDDAAIAGFDDGGAEPAFGGRGHGDGEVAILDGAARGEILLWEGDDQVGLAERPVAGRGRGSDEQRVGAGAAGRTGFGPRVQGGSFGGSDCDVVRENAKLRIGVPGRHALEEQTGAE